MKNAIYEICQKLRGYTVDAEYFEVLKANRDENGDIVVVCREVDPAAETKTESQGAQNESN